MSKTLKINNGITKLQADLAKIFLHLVNSVASIIGIGAKVESNRWTCSMLLKRVLLFDSKRQAHQ